MDKLKQQQNTKIDTSTDSSLNLNNKRKLNDTNDEESNNKINNKSTSNQESSSTTTTESDTKKLKPFVGLKPNKIQLKLTSTATSAVSSTKTTDKLKSDSIKPLAKLPTGNLAPSSNSLNKQQQPLVKNDKIAKVFGSDDDDDNEAEEMPLEAKMKMKNVGRNTPTSTGPNSYGKTSLGFCDSRALFEKRLKEKAEQLLKEEEDTPAAK